MHVRKTFWSQQGFNGSACFGIPLFTVIGVAAWLRAKVTSRSSAARAPRVYRFLVLAAFDSDSNVRCFNH